MATIKVFHLLSFLVCFITVPAQYTYPPLTTDPHTSTAPTHTNTSSTCHYETSIKYKILTMFSVGVLITGIIGNTLVIFVIQYSHSLRKQPGYLILTSLAAADLGVSFFVTTFKVDMYVRNGNFCHGASLCVFIHLTDTLFPITSITHLLIICLNRYYAVTRSYSYHMNVTYAREKMVCVGVWCYAFVWTAAGVVTWDGNPSLYYEVVSRYGGRYCGGNNKNYYITVTCLIYIAPMVLTTVLYSIILKVAIRKATEAPHRLLHMMKAKKKRSKWNPTPAQANKGVRTLVIVFAAYVICWLPNFLVILITMYNPIPLHNFHFYHPIIADVVTTIISNILPPINSAINPFIYFTSSDKFQHAFKDGVLKMRKKSRYSDGMTRADTLLMSSQRMRNRSSTLPINTAGGDGTFSNPRCGGSSVTLVSPTSYSNATIGSTTDVTASSVQVNSEVVQNASPVSNDSSV